MTACSSQARKLGGSLWECFVSSNTKKCESWHMSVHAHLAMPGHHQLSTIKHPLPQPLRASAQHPRALSTLKPSSLSSASPHSPATWLQTLGSTYGNISTTHLQTKRDTGSIKRTCTTQEASAAAHQEKYINIDCSSEDSETKHVLIEPTHSA